MSRRTVTLFVALISACVDASAHGSSKSLGNFFGGFVHPLLEPAHLIVLLSLALCLGQRGLESAGPAVPCFMAGLVPGLVAAGLGCHPDTDVLLLAIATFAGIAVAASAALPSLTVGAGCLLAGAGIGLGSSPESVAGGELLATLLGMGFGAVIWLFNGASLVHHARRPWLMILVRVAGSWTTASSVLVLALWFAGAHSSTPSSTQAPMTLDPRK